MDLTHSKSSGSPREIVRSGWRRRCALLRSFQNRIDHPHVTCAAAEMPTQHFAYLLLGRLGVVAQECFG